MSSHNYYVYIMTNRYNTVLYTGVTNDLAKRASEHREKIIPGFTSRYNVGKLVYFEAFEHIDAARAREKQIEAGSRRKKLELVNRMNPEWRKLAGDL